MEFTKKAADKEKPDQLLARSTENQSINMPKLAQKMFGSHHNLKTMESTKKLVDKERMDRLLAQSMEN